MLQPEEKLDLPLTNELTWTRTKRIVYCSVWSAKLLELIDQNTSFPMLPLVWIGRSKQAVGDLCSISRPSKHAILKNFTCSNPYSLVSGRNDNALNVIMLGGVMNFSQVTVVVVDAVLLSLSPGKVLVDQFETKTVPGVWTALYHSAKPCQ